MIPGMFLTGMAFIGGNFVYASFTGLWAAAFERTFFQGVLLLWLMTFVALWRWHLEPGEGRCDH